jgi:Mn-dependent DtxR family transcriptional regulator
MREANMGRKVDNDRVRQIANYVSKHPGARQADIAAGLQVPRSSVARTLPALDEAGYLLWEDGRGRLWPFAKRNRR